MQLWKYSAYVPSQMILKDFHYHQKANYTRPLPPPVIITFCSSQLSNSFFVWTVYNFCFMSAVLLMFNALVKISFLTRLKNVNLNSDPVPEFWRVLYKLNRTIGSVTNYHIILFFWQNTCGTQGSIFLQCNIIRPKKLCP